MNVGESSDDNLRACPEPFVPSEAWIDAVDAQCTDAMLKRLRRYALLLARLPGGEHLGDHASYAEEVVQTAATDIAAGVLRWDPATGDLEPLLTDTIRLRVRRDRKRAARYKHVSIDTAHAHERVLAIDEVEAYLAASASPEPDESEASSSGSLNRSLRRLRGLVSADALAQRFLDAVDANATTRVEIMKHTGLTRAEYHNTRRRLARLLAQLTPKSSSPEEDN